MDPNRWPAIAWILVPLVIGTCVVFAALLIWRAAFRRRPGWLLDTVLLGSSGLMAVVVVMLFLFWSGGKLDKGWEKLIGEALLGSTGLFGVWLSDRILGRKSRVNKGR
jgi:hypothetical protein